ncbi:Mu transposase domain-containing protein [Nocardia wallacei]|uniref:Mu transposase domain-containing protein n=1 Tax=Nocardia wallacei TaxID=480035 RepID=UPI0024567005|nr:IS21 family transposase [Nocardia wallacei]
MAASAYVGYDTVRAYIRDRKPEIRVQADRAPSQVFIAQSPRPGAEAEVDFGEIVVRRRAEQETWFLCSMRRSFSGKAVHRASSSGGQEAFFEGHAHAFAVIGGVPGRIRYDNLKAAVASVLGFDRQRVETARWAAFRSAYDIDASYCRPGVEGAHEKGGVEGDIGFFRRNRSVPVPEVGSIGELNAMIDAFDIADDNRRIGTRAVRRRARRRRKTAAETASGRAGGDRALVHPARGRYAQITVRSNKYSIPVRLVGRQVRVLLAASELVVYDGRTEIARHERAAGRGRTCLELDHYLEGLLRKPGALPGSTVLEQARAAGKFTPVHDAWWAASRKAHGDAADTKALIEVLLLHRHMRHEHVVAGLVAALAAGALTPDAVALEARKTADADRTGSVGAEPPGDAPEVASLTARRLRQLPPDTRPVPTVDAYDQLPHHTRTTGQTGGPP